MRCEKHYPQQVAIRRPILSNHGQLPVRRQELSLRAGSATWQADPSQGAKRIRLTHEIQDPQARGLLIPLERRCRSPHEPADVKATLCFSHRAALHEGRGTNARID
jgi:hypothetical protein